MLLRGKGLADGFNTFLSVAIANNMPKLFSSFSRCEPITDDKFILFIRNLASWVLPGLETLDE